MKQTKRKTTKSGSGRQAAQSQQTATIDGMPTSLLQQVSSWRFALNYLSTLLFIVACYGIITYVSNFHQHMMGAMLDLNGFGIPIRITIHNLFLALLAVYAVVLIPYYACQPWLHSKAFVFLRGLFYTVFGKSQWTRTTTQAGLALLLKFFFAPLMINWCLAHIGDMLGNIQQVIWGIQADRTGRMLFDNGLFWACFQTILFVDTLLFTLGYIIELPRLKNEIRSVEPTFLGWFVCLACYPPFNDATNMAFAWRSNDFPYFQSDAWHFVMNCGILVLMGVYSWCSVALGFKASNLTNRGIVSRGPYAWVRHPAYTAKNLAWWIGALPTFYMAFGGGLRGGVDAVVATAGWTFIYAMRAITEERHLLLGNNGYREYMKKVKWRFIPGVF